MAIEKASCDSAYINYPTLDYILLCTVDFEMFFKAVFSIILQDMLKKKVAFRDIVKIEKSQIFILFENKAPYKDFFVRKCFKSCYGYFG